MIDPIERQDAIDIVQGYAKQLQGYIGMPNDSEVYAYARGLLLSIDRNIKALQSAQPEPCEDAVSRKAVEEMLKNGFPARGMWEIEGDVVKQTVCETLVDALMDLEKLPSAQLELSDAVYQLWKRAYEAGERSTQPEPLTNKEQRIFLAAMGREEKVCEEVDRNYVREPYEDSLVRVCKEIRRKVKGALWI